MGCRVVRVASILSAIALSSVTSNVSAQRRAPAETQTNQAIQVALNIGGAPYKSDAAGKCTHAPIASIFKTVAEMWTVQQNAEGRSLALTLWKPKDGSGEMVTLSVTSSNLSHQVNTVRGGATTGSGRVTLARTGSGGTFSVDAKTASGSVITGTIKCDAFAPHMAGGG